MAENLSERGFIGEVVKAEILHFVQDDTPGGRIVNAETLRFAQSDRKGVVLERASASEGPHKQLVCSLMFLRLTKQVKQLTQRLFASLRVTGTMPE